MKPHLWSHKFLREDRAAVTIEFVVMLPVFLAALAFSYEFGQFFLAQQSTVNNVRAAARFLSRVELNETSKDTAEEIIRFGRILPPANPGDPVPEPPDYLKTACTAPNPRCVDWDGNTIEITVRAKYKLSIFGLADKDAPADIPFAIRERIRWVGM